MIKPDAILTWPRHIDYPLFRYNIKRFRKYFDNVLIALTDHGQEVDYTKFIVNALPDVQFKSIDRNLPGDWRNNAVNTMLEKSEASYVMFLEQDFLIRDERFFEVLLNVSDYNFIYYDEQGRIHPACALVDRETINKTSKDFAARPPAFDHFGLFFTEALRIMASADLETIGLRKEEDYYHLAGLTQNYHATPYFKPNEFLTYNHYATKLPIEYNEFKVRMGSINEPFEENKMIADFFPKGEK